MLLFSGLGSFLPALASAVQCLRLHLTAKSIRTQRGLLQSVHGAAACHLEQWRLTVRLRAAKRFWLWCKLLQVVHCSACGIRLEIPGLAYSDAIKLRSLRGDTCNMAASVSAGMAFSAPCPKKSKTFIASTSKF